MRKLPVLAVLAVVSVSCANKARECNELATVINQAANSFKKMGEIAEKSPEKTRPAAEECSRVTKEALARMAGLKLKVKELQSYSAQYQDMARNAVAAVDELLGVLGEIEKMDAKATAQGKQVEAAATAFGADCAAGNKKALESCAKFQTIMSSLSPTDPDAFAKQVAELKALPVDASLKKSAGTLVAQLEAGVGVMREAKRLTNRSEEIGKKFEKEGAKEDGIVDGMNKFCGLKAPAP